MNYEALIPSQGSGDYTSPLLYVPMVYALLGSLDGFIDPAAYSMCNIKLFFQVREMPLKMHSQYRARAHFQPPAWSDCITGNSTATASTNGISVAVGYWGFFKYGGPRFQCSSDFHFCSCYMFFANSGTDPAPTDLKGSLSNHFKLSWIGK